MDDDFILDPDGCFEPPEDSDEMTDEETRHADQS
jgi:hypothetical protein